MECEAKLANRLDDQSDCGVLVEAVRKGIPRDYSHTIANIGFGIPRNYQECVRPDVLTRVMQQLYRVHTVTVESRVS